MKKDLIKQLIQARGRLLKAIKKYPDHPEGHWSRKELLSHIAGWDEEDVAEIQPILRGEKPISFGYSVDGYNKISVRKRKDKTEKEILLEMKKLHKQFIKELQELNEEMMTGYFGTKVRGTPVNVVWIINETIHHDNEHAREIEEKYQ